MSQKCSISQFLSFLRAGKNSKATAPCRRHKSRSPNARNAVRGRRHDLSGDLYRRMHPQQLRCVALRCSPTPRNSYTLARTRVKLESNRTPASLRIYCAHYVKTHASLRTTTRPHQPILMPLWSCRSLHVVISPHEAEALRESTRHHITHTMWDLQEAMPTCTPKPKGSSPLTAAPPAGVGLPTTSHSGCTAPL